MTDLSTLPEGLSDDELDELEALLANLHERDEEAPQWEFCDGYLTAVVCTRRVVQTWEWLPQLIATILPGEPCDDDELTLIAPFADIAQQQRFVALCHKRMAQVRAQLALPVETLEDEQAFSPEVIDMRTLAARLPEAEREALEGEAIPSLGQLWAMGFVCAVEDLAQDWEAPRDRDQARWLQDAMGLVEALLDDDEGEPVLNLYDDEPPHGVSQERLDAFGELIWAVYDLRELWHGLGPRVHTYVREEKIGRNDPCPCGSGKKYKKCCGA